MSKFKVGDKVISKESCNRIATMIKSGRILTIENITRIAIRTSLPNPLAVIFSVTELELRFLFLDSMFPGHP